jgi:hypothetical protein
MAIGKGDDVRARNTNTNLGRVCMRGGTFGKIFFEGHLENTSTRVPLWPNGNAT